MSKLLVLAEIDCSKFLIQRGIHPDEFYTDFVLFRNMAFSFHDVDIIVLFAGSCSFSKRHVFDIIKTLDQRAKNPDDTGVRSLTILTDVFLPRMSRYYKFQGKLTNISEYSGWKLVEKNSDIWSRVPKGTESGKTKYFLTDKDKGNVEKLKERYKENVALDEELRDLIQIPSFSKISEI